MGSRYPWSVLEISPTDDEAAIRKAYAVKLRVTRPDEDPKGFQALREARDAALAEGRYLDRSDVLDSGPPETIVPVAEQIIEVRPASRPASEQPSPEPAQSADVGTVNLGDVLEAPSPVADDGSPDIAEMLDNVGKAHPWRDLKAQWAEVFDLMEADSFTNHGFNMWTVLSRLLDDIRRDKGELPDVSEWQIDPRGSASRLLGVYEPILQDFERRFGILNHDTVLLEYLSEEDARDFLNALTIAVGRQAMPQSSERSAMNVEPIEPAYVEAAWGDDLKMLDYYREARAKDAFPWNFSWLALLFPLPFALYYRLTGVAALAGILVGANAAFQVMEARGLDTPFAPLASTVYLVTAGALAFNWRRIRVQALAARVRKLTDQRLGTLEIQEQMRAWGRPSPTEMWLGVAALIFAVTVRVLAR